MTSSDNDLGKQFEALAKETAAQVENIDLSGVMAKRLAEMESKRSWRFAYYAVPALAVLVIVVGLQWWQHRSPVFSATLDATSGALVSKGDTSESVVGIGIRLTSPFAVQTNEAQSATLRFDERELRLSADTRIQLSDAGDVELQSGHIALRSPSPQPLHCGSTQFLSTGMLVIEKQPDRGTMKLLNRHKIAATSAVIAIAVYAGWTTIKTSQGDIRVDAPGGAYVDGEGQAHPFDLADGLPTRPNGGLAAFGLSGTDGEPEEHMSAGAFWNDEQKVMLFRVPGEVFDAESGEALDAFDLEAVSIHSQGYAQTQSLRRSFSGLQDGHFELMGLGLGTWQVTARHSGYAPVVQTLEIDSLNADPYLVIPLSSGAQISGRVIDWRGRSVADAKIGLTQCFQVSEEGKGCELAKTASDGTFVLSKVPEDAVYSLYAKHDRYGFASSKNLRATVEQEGSEHITIVLSGIVRIHGQVLRGKEDTPVAGATVEGGGKQVQADANGFYELTIPLEDRPEAHVASYPNAPEGRARIESYPQDRSARSLQWVEADTHAAEVQIDFHLEMSEATLVGQVVDHEGQPVIGVDLRLANTNGWSRERSHQTFPTLAVTDKDGRYTVHHIPAKAGYQVEFRSTPQDKWQHLGYVNVNEETQVEANFHIGSGSIRGRFVDASGKALAVSEFSCSRMGAERRDANSVFALPQCYPDGRFEFVDLGPGQYLLHDKVEWMGSSLKFKEKQVRLKAGQVLTMVEVEVEGEPATTYRFRILGEENEFLEGAFIGYFVDKTMMTMNLRVGDDGTASQQVSAGIEEISVEVPGYLPQPIVLSDYEPGQIVEARLTRTATSPEE